MRKFLSNKKGIELTINFVVILIIGIAMLSGALMMTSKLFKQAGKYKETVDANTKNEIRKLITDSDDLVVIYPSRKTIPRSKSHTFGVGVQNVGLDYGGATNNFALGVTLSKALDKNKQEICLTEGGIYGCSQIIQNCDKYTKTSEKKDCLEENWVLAGGTLQIKKNDMETFALPITVSKEGIENKKLPSGIYIFNVCVCHGPDPTCVDINNDPVNCYPGSVSNLYGNINKIYVQVT